MIKYVHKNAIIFSIKHYTLNMSTEFERCSSQVIHPEQHYQSWAEFLKMPHKTPEPSAPPLSPEQSPMSQIHYQYNNCNRTNQNNDDETDDVFYTQSDVVVDTPERTPMLKATVRPRQRLHSTKYDDIVNTSSSQIYCYICYKYVPTNIAPNRRITSKGQWCGNCNKDQFHTEELHFTFMSPCEYCDNETAVYELVTVKFYGNPREVCGSCVDKYGSNYPI